MKSAFILVALLLAPQVASAQSLNDTMALKGLTSVKMICDVNVGDPAALLRRLELIDETYTQLVDAGITPIIVIAFRGPATNYVTQGDGYVPAEHLKTKKEIQGLIGQFHENGFILEQCAIAARAQKVAYKDILPKITVVQNGYVSLVAYQNKGYALLPMD